MKKVLFTLLITIAMLIGEAQAPSIWFNELVPDPGPNETEYIEFYNTSTLPISLDCYFVVSYFENQQEKGIYVYNFPKNATIKGLSYYMMSSSNPVYYKSNEKDVYYTPTDPTSFNNWNVMNGSGGYISKYTYGSTNGNDKGGTNTWGTGETVDANFDNFINVANGRDAVLFLYKMNSDGTASYENGFVANPQGSSVTSILASIEALGSLTISGDCSCATNPNQIQLNFSGLSGKSVDVITIQEATGRGQGYAKKGDGFCGNWEKISQGEFSPGGKNNFGTATPEITTVDNYYCNNSVSFSITSGTSKYFPIEVQLFYDKGTIGVFDAEDEYRSSLWVQSPNGTYQTFPIDGLNQPVILVYKSSTGCFNKIAVPTTPATPVVNLTGEISCSPNANNKRTLNFSISNISDVAVFPFSVQYTEDNGTPGNASDDKVTTLDPITSTSQLAYSFELANNSSNVTVLLQSSPITCVTKSLIAPNNCTVLPVRLRSFSAVRNKQKNEQVVLKWETSSEQNNRGFHVQRKTSGEWKEVAFVPTQARSGNSNYLLTYEFTDINSFYNTSQYRLLQVDIDGKATFSDVKNVTGTEQNDGVLIYPNPGINGRINVVFKEQNATKHVIVFDNNGRIIQQFPQVRDNSLTIQGLAIGFYTVKIIDGTTMKVSVEKVIIK